jgi:hypothetical protein
MADDWEGVEEIDTVTFLGGSRGVQGHAPMRRVRLTNLGEGQILELAASPQLDNVSHLDLSSNRIGYQLAPALIGSEYLGNVTHLDLSGNRILSVERLVVSPYLRKLHDLRLRDNGIDAAQAEDLAETPNVEHLANLDLRNNRINDWGMQKLAGSERFPPEMTISVDGFQGSFAEFQQWARRRGRTDKCR